MTFLSGVGPYKELVARAAFILFVERVEDMIASENSATLNVMTVASESAQQPVVPK
jgi:hypothetical protein